jgi:putative CocE/NonD family hydrolase
MNFRISLVLAAALVSTDTAAVQEAPQGGVIQAEKNLMVPMRDGVRLATDVYRPAVDGKPVEAKLPLLLHRTAYGKTGERLVSLARFFARNGYVVAVQDDRGTYESEGVQTKYIGMGRDGYDAIEYLAKLPYVDGQVGMWGTSYAAHTQATAAILNPPHLKTMVLNMGGVSNGWDHKIRNHGAFELAQQVGWAFTQLAEQDNQAAARAVMQQEKPADWVAVLHAKRGLNPLSIAPNFEEYIFDMMTRGDYDDYWKQPDVNWSRHYGVTSDIPMMHVTGWYDSYAGSGIANYVGLSKVKRSPMRLLVGPWLHGRNAQSNAGDVEFGPDAALADFHDRLHLRWFDHFLKRRNNGVAEEPAAQIFVMGTGDGHKDANGRLVHGGYWKTVASWPLPGTRFVNYYFHADGGLRPRAPSAEAVPTVYTFDPRDPVPTIGGSFSSTAGLAMPGAFDQRERPFTAEPLAGFLGSKPPFLPLRARADVVVFQTDPLAEDVEVVGPIVVKLFASSTAVDTDFTAKLVDVYPPSKDYPLGFEMNLTDGILRARYRSSPEKPEFMRPGEVYEFRIDPFPTANVFKTGHRIRIDISSSNFPRFDVNPNTGEPVGMDRRVVVADNSIFHDPKRPSHVVLPIVPRSGPAPSRAAGR